MKRFRVALFLFSFIALRAGRPDESGYRLLEKAESFADLYNWRVASPLFQKAVLILRTTGDQRNAMYARVGVLRLASTAPILERSQELGDLLNTNELFRQDRDLRLFALTVKVLLMVRSINPRRAGIGRVPVQLKAEFRAKGKEKSCRRNYQEQDDEARTTKLERRGKDTGVAPAFD